MELNAKNIKKLLWIITFTVVLFVGLTHFTVVQEWLAWGLQLILPFLLGLAMAFIVNVLMRVLEDRLFAPLNRRCTKRWPKFRRPLALLLSLAVITAVVFVLLFLIVPEIRRTIFLLADQIPGFISQLQTWANELIVLFKLSPDQIPWLQLDWNKITVMVGTFLRNSGQYFFDTTVGITTSIFNVFFNFLLGLVFSIYVLLRKETLCRQFKKLFYAYLPKNRVEYLLSVTTVSNRLFSKFVTGQLTEALIIGSLCFAGMMLFRLPYAVMISALVGFTALIPVFGAFIGTAVGAFLILMEDPSKAFWFVIFIICLQQLEGNLIYPKVVGKSVGLPGMWVLVAVTVGGSTYGILGMLLSVPICSVVYCLLGQAVNKRLKKRNISVE